MAYGFNEDKSKAEIPKIVSIEGTIQQVDAGKVVYKAFSKQELESNYGIDDIDDYIPISIVQEWADYWVTASFYFKQEGYAVAVYPNVQIDPNSARATLSIVIYNASGLTKDIRYRVALLKIK